MPPTTPHTTHTHPQPCPWLCLWTPVLLHTLPAFYTHVHYSRYMQGTMYSAAPTVDGSPCLSGSILNTPISPRLRVSLSTTYSNQASYPPPLFPLSPPSVPSYKQQPCLSQFSQIFLPTRRSLRKTAPAKTKYLLKPRNSGTTYSPQGTIEATYEEPLYLTLPLTHILTTQCRSFPVHKVNSWKSTNFLHQDQR